MGSIFPPLQKPSVRAITFTAESIRKIDLGCKTQTRRVIYPPPAECDLVQDPRTPLKWRPAGGAKSPLSWRIPYGIVGDRLWIRQVWARVEPNPTASEDFRMPVAWRVEQNPVLLDYWRKRVIFLSDHPGKMPRQCDCGVTDNAWRSPVTMPRWAARQWLRITGLRAERLQMISAEDAIAEGAQTIEAFALLWDRINGSTHPWASNPWVWRIEFEKSDGLRALQSAD